MNWKKWIWNVLLWGLAIAIIAYMLRGAVLDQSFDRLANQPKHWGYFGLAAAACMAAVCLTFVRWYLLVRVLGLPFHLRDAFRLGFLGYLLNFVSLGSVGGDLFKAVFIAREQPRARAEAVASVIVDRISGLYALFFLSSAAVLFTDAGRAARQTREVGPICDAALIATAVGALVIVVMFIPGFTRGTLSRRLASIPKIGHTIQRLIGAIRLYRQNVPALGVSLLLSIIVQSLYAIGFYWIAKGLPGNSPSLAAHFFIVPVAMLTAVLPLPMNALGPVEAVVEFLYLNIPSAAPVPAGQGFVVTLAYRVITVLIAAIGFAIYFVSRREVSKMLKEAEQLETDNPHVAAAN